MKKRVLFDATTGTSGDMIVAALLDAGANRKKVVDAMETSANFLDDLTVSIEKSDNGVCIKLAHPERKHRHADELIAVLKKATDTLKITSDFPINCLMTLINAECAIHNSDLNALHLHELGSADTIATIIGSFVAADDLNLFDGGIVATPIATGYGKIQIAHGIVDVPAPVTAKILENYKTIRGPIEGEVTTPTGAAILTNLIDGQIDDITPAIKKKGAGIGEKTFTPSSSLTLYYSD